MHRTIFCWLPPLTSRQTTGKNSSKGGGVGVSFGGGTNGGRPQYLRRYQWFRGQGERQWHDLDRNHAGCGKNVSSQADVIPPLSGLRSSGEKVTADVGNNLTISSLQDGDRYDSRQNSVAAGGSLRLANVRQRLASKHQPDKIKSNYDSVREQSGIYAGKDGFDVTVGNHTQLNGG